MKNIENYRKYDISYNFRFTEKMIFSSIAENQENMIFTLSVFEKQQFVFHAVLHNVFTVITFVVLW